MFEAKEIAKGDEVKVNLGALKNMMEPQLNLVKQVIKKAGGKPVVIRIADDSVDIAESPMAGAMVGTVQVPKDAVSVIGGKKETKDSRMDVDAKDQIKPLKKKESKMNLSKKLMGLLDEDNLDEAFDKIESRVDEDGCVSIKLDEDKWKKLPKGWTKDSAKSMWKSLTGDKKHKVSACMKKMSGKVDDPGAFCGGLASKIGAR